MFDVSDDGSIIRAQNVIRAAVEDIRDGVPPGIISAKFHLAVADLIAMVSRSVREERKLNQRFITKRSKIRPAADNRQRIVLALMKTLGYLAQTE